MWKFIVIVVILLMVIFIISVVFGAMISEVFNEADNRDIEEYEKWEQNKNSDESGKKL